MALKDLVSDLSNFKGQSQYDKLDSQIKVGVDFFDNSEGKHYGFKPKTNLESHYFQYLIAKGASVPKFNEENLVPPGDGIIAAPNAGVRRNNKQRLAYGQTGEYSEFGKPGLSEPSHIFPNDNILGVKLQPQFTSDFMTTPLAEYNSKYSLQDKVGAGSKTMSVPKEAFRISKTEPMNDTFQSSFSVNTMKKEYGDSSYIEDLFEFKWGTFKNVPAGINDKGNFGTKSFRAVADPNNFDLFRQPFILRETGNQWGIDKVETDNPIGAIVGGAVNSVDSILGKFFRGAPTFTGLLSRSITDKFRIGKFLLTMDGIGFIGKQYALQALNPTLESKIYNPLSALSITGVGQMLDTIKGVVSGGGTGVADLASGIGSAIVSAFLPIGHPERHVGGIKYEDVNPLDRLEEDKGLGKKIKDIPVIGNTLFNKINDKIDEVGGFSRLGAQANMKFTVAGQTTSLKLKDRMLLMNPNKYLFPISSAPMSVVDGVPKFTIEAGSGDGSAAQIEANKVESKAGGTFNKKTAIKDDGDAIKRHSTLEYSKLNDNFSYESLGLTTPRQLDDRGQGTLVTAAGYQARIDGQEINNDIGKENLSLEVTDNPVLGKIKGDMLSSNVDMVNMTPYGASVDGEIINVNDSVTTKDFIKFRFKDVINDKFLIFRAILEGITDTVTPEYAEDRYIGRPDKLFVYQGVDRSIAFTFSIYPKTKQELPVLMEKLNYLVGLCYPSYTESERMVSPFIELTMGDMFVETPGILSSLVVTVEEATTWEIEEGLQFPHYIKAACEFRHIGNYIPSMKGKHYDLNWVESDGFYNEAEGSPTTNHFTDENELGFPLYPDRSQEWRDNVFAQLGQDKRGSEQ